MSAPLGSDQDSTAGNESRQTGHKQQCIGSCDGCYHDRWIGEVRMLCSSVGYCKEVKDWRGFMCTFVFININLLIWFTLHASPFTSDRIRLQYNLPDIIRKMV